MRGYSLSIRKGFERKVCYTWRKVGDEKQGIRVYMVFLPDNDIRVVFGGYRFNSEKEGLWYWFRYKETEPEKTQGWYAKCEYFED